MTTGQRNGLLLVISSPSGAGKSTLTRRLLEDDTAFEMSVSATTRPAREGETHGKHYFFLDRSQFEQMIGDGGLLEYAGVFGNLYGTPRAPVEAAIGAGRDVLFDVDWQGAQQLRLSALGNAVVSVFILPPSITTLEQRLISRGKDAPDVIRGRMDQAMSEISHWAEYDYVLVNDNLETCYDQIRTIVSAERLRLIRQPGMRGFVDDLGHEFRERKP
ncbi:MAG: guanylate kinase [Paracoccaceae bacterium]